jgi:gas vesicle protein
MDDNKLSYFVFGLGMGVAIGVLFAPKSGEETRGLIKDKADEGREFLRRKSGEIRETATDALDRGRDVLNTQKENLSAALEAGKQAYRQSVSASPSQGTERASGM